MVQIQTLGEGEGEQRRAPRMPQGSAPQLPDFAAAAAAPYEAEAETYGVLRSIGEKMQMIKLDKQLSEAKLEATKFISGLEEDADKMPAVNSVEYFTHHAEEYKEKLAENDYAPIVRRELEKAFDRLALDGGMNVQESALKRAEKEQKDIWTIRAQDIMKVYRRTFNMSQFIMSSSDLMKEIDDSPFYTTPAERTLAKRSLNAQLVGDVINFNLDSIDLLYGQERKTAVKNFLELMDSGKLDTSLITNMPEVKKKLQELTSKAIEETAEEVAGDIAKELAESSNVETLGSLGETYDRIYQLRLQGGDATPDNLKKDAVHLTTDFLRNVPMPQVLTVDELDVAIKTLDEYWAATGVDIDAETLYGNEITRREERYKAVTKEKSKTINRMVDDGTFNPTAGVEMAKALIGRNDIIRGAISDGSLLDDLFGEALANQEANLQTDPDAKENILKILAVYETFGTSSKKQGDAAKALIGDIGETDGQRVARLLVDAASMGEASPGVGPLVNEGTLLKAAINNIPLDRQIPTAEALAKEGRLVGPFFKERYTQLINGGEIFNAMLSMRRVGKAAVGRLNLGGLNSTVGFVAHFALTASLDEVRALADKHNQDTDILLVAQKLAKDIMLGQLDTLYEGELKVKMRSARSDLRKIDSEGRSDQANIFNDAAIKSYTPRLAFYLADAASKKGLSISSFTKNLPLAIWNEQFQGVWNLALKGLEEGNKLVRKSVGDYGSYNQAELFDNNPYLTKNDKRVIDWYFGSTVPEEEYLETMLVDLNRVSIRWGYHNHTQNPKKREQYAEQHPFNTTMLDVRQIYPDVIPDLSNIHIFEDIVVKGEKVVVVPLARHNGEIFGYLANNLNPDGTLSPTVRLTDGIISTEEEWLSLGDIGDADFIENVTALEARIGEAIEIDTTFSEYGHNLYSYGNNSTISAADAVEMFTVDALAEFGEDENPHPELVMKKVIDLAEEYGWIFVTDSDDTMADDWKK